MYDAYIDARLAEDAETYTQAMRQYIQPTNDGFDVFNERKYIENRQAGLTDITTVEENAGL